MTLLQIARSDSSHGEMRTFLKPIETLWKQGKTSGVLYLGIFQNHHVPENNCMYCKSHRSQIFKNTLKSREKPKTNGQFEKEAVSMIYGTVGIGFFLKIGTDPRNSES